MRCGYLHQFRLSGAGFPVESCTACRSPYVPSISELHDYCRGKEYRKCPVLLEKERSVGDAGPVGVRVRLDP
ncbi:MAG: hypothetical protein K8I29_14350 [Alphaproteobacteria bacterium]|uniref:Uncharacterized protein n=1 Tax=Candidatus Nitrobium versatile TaxID=2884831 RepID=A0A953JEY8_9BACT|nr:hypothetical protein [Candidatus Nitrobium versatile]